MVLPDVYGFAGHENCWVRRQIDTGLAHVNYRNAIKCTLWQRLVRLLRDVWRENSKWELMRHRRLERVGNGKFPCGLCWKLKAVRGGVEVEGEAGKREEEGGGNLRRGEFPLPSHPHAFQTSPDRQSWAQCPVWLPQFSPKWYQIRASHWFSNINLQPPCDFDQRYKC